MMGVMQLSSPPRCRQVKEVDHKVAVIGLTKLTILPLHNIKTLLLSASKNRRSTK